MLLLLAAVSSCRPALRPRSRVAMAISREDSESNQRLVEAMFGSVEEFERVLKDPDIPSHKQLDLDEVGKPLQIRFAYVDEVECIGCTYCASVARNTFYMNPDAGRARVFAQGQDDPELVMEAIECCPVNCISFVDHDDLVILEMEREEETILPTSIGGFKEYQVRASRTASKAKGGSSQVCCNNCPSRGCKECPMYGIGLNPAYVARLEAREAKKTTTGESAREAFDVSAQQKLDVLFSAPIEPLGTLEDPPPPTPTLASLARPVDESGRVREEAPAEELECDVAEVVVDGSTCSSGVVAPTAAAADETAEAPSEVDIFAAIYSDEVPLGELTLGDE